MYTKLIKEFVSIELLLTAAQIDAWLVRNTVRVRRVGSNST